MPIEEKPQPLEFTCVIKEKGIDDISWEIKYDPTDIIGLSIKGHNQEFQCPIGLFQEVTQFLQGKGILKLSGQVVNTLNIVADGEQPTHTGTLLPIPTIINSNSEKNSEIGPQIEPITSFDIVTDIPNNEGNEDDDEISQTETTTKTKTVGTVVKGSIEKEVINRAVIRTRVNEEDPMSAEREAAELRGIGEAGDKKTIKRKSQTD